MKVLDKGSVELLDVLGYDWSPIEAARVSYGGDKYEDEEKNLKLLEYLYQNEHLSTLEHIVFKFRVKAPIFVLRQWLRHRMSSPAERSGRYSKFDEGEYYVPDKMRVQDTVNKQGSIEDEKGLLEHYKGQIKEHSQVSYALYQEMIQNGVAKELARIILPLNFYSEIIWTVNMRSLFNFLKQRLDEHAQWEIRQYAKAIEEIITPLFPYNMEMFEKHIKNS